MAWYVLPCQEHRPPLEVLAHLFHLFVPPVLGDRCDQQGLGYQGSPQYPFLPLPLASLAGHHCPAVQANLKNSMLANVQTEVRHSYSSSIGIASFPLKSVTDQELQNS
ncbi:hypothetical protein E2C01_016071 [Portunus trituberculatus]|uniref:Uncharacterized protein n=1 Tax=Portunus trituberculatus TaxID=210409 RepID=A0A5B7DQ40_PORTR|nr:hypothetical protein [Portunus trituberculatus]